MRARWLVLAALVTPGAATAQRPTPTARPPVAADTTLPDTTLPDTGAITAPRPRLGGDTARADSAQPPKDLVKWAEPDSVLSALLARPGYVATRYQGKAAVFDASRHTLTLSGDGAVQREQTILVADTIRYNDSTKIVRATAPPRDTIVLRDPTQGTSDIVALGGLEYDIAARKGLGTRISTSSQQAGQTWYVVGHHTAVVGDSTGNGRSTSYAEGGAITSCNLPYPHYHFQAGEVKMISKSLLVARPAVLYIADIPVMWLPFVFQDMRAGRRSGIIPPRFGLTDIVRTSSGYRREIDNLGYYFAINDYMDATVSLDWRSGNGDDDSFDSGWTRYNAEWRYSWLDRFLNGGIRTSYSTFGNGAKALNLSWNHQQRFSRTSSINANINYASNTTAIQQQAYNALTTLAAITSQLAVQKALGPANITLGGSRTQYTGREEVNQNFPNFSVTTKPVAIGSWFLWSPQLSVNNTQTFNLDAAPFRYVPNGTTFDSVRVKADQRSTDITFQTPLRIFGFNWQNSFRINDHEENFPRAYDVVDFQTGQKIGRRVYARTFDTRVDWQTGISLPAILQGSLKLTPSIAIVNADPAYPFWVRSTFSGGHFVHQSKTLQYSISASPTLFGFFPGFGPFSRIRHSIQPQISYGYSPAANVSDEFLEALYKTRAGYPGGLQRSALTFQLNQVFEAKLKSDTAPEGGEKIKLLSLSFSPITYDFERARKTGLSGFTTTSFSYRLASDLLPGFDLSVDYSLYQGDVQSDTARFKPFRTGISASFSIGRNNNPLTVLGHIFGRGADSGTARTGAQPAGGSPASDVLDQQPPIAGPNSYTGYQTPINTAAGWSAEVRFTSHRSRPIVGAKVFDPRTLCRQFLLLNDPFNYERCLAHPPPADTLDHRFGGAEVIVPPPQATLQGSLAFNLTPKWAMQWRTGYDFELHEFSDHEVVLQRDMHDWRANITFSRAPTGSFRFSFFVSLKAEPDLKFDYRRSTNRCTSETCGNIPPP